MKWYIIRAICGRENSVKKYLDEKIRFDPAFRVFFGEILVPSESVLNFSAKNKIRKMYPGYIFAEIKLESHLVDLIRRIPGSLGIMCNPSGDPYSVPEKEINKILSHLKGGRVKVIEKRFSVGEQVSINDGAFKGFSGTVNKISGKKVTVLVSIFGRPTPVELDCSQVVVV